MKRHMDIETAIQVLTAAGYKVTKPRAPKPVEHTRPRLNAVRKPYSPQYDPKYRVKYKTPKAWQNPMEHDHLTQWENAKEIEKKLKHSCANHR